MESTISHVNSRSAGLCGKLLPAAFAHKLIVSFGLYPFSIGEGQQSVEDVFKSACNEAIRPGYIPLRPEFRLLQRKDQVVAISGSPLMEIGTTNLIQIRRLE